MRLAPPSKGFCGLALKPMKAPLESWAPPSQKTRAVEGFSRGGLAGAATAPSSGG